MKKNIVAISPLIYVVMLFAVVGTTCIGIFSGVSQKENRELKKWPVRAEAWFAPETARLLRLVKSGPATSAQAYFSMLVDIEELEGSCRRFLNENPRNYQACDAVGIRHSLTSEWANINLRVIQKEFSDSEITAAREKFISRLSLSRSNPEPEPEYSPTLRWFALTYVLLMAFMPLHLAIRVWDAGQSFHRETRLNGHWMALAVLIPFWGLFKYRLTDPWQKISAVPRLLLQMASCVLSGAITICAAFANQTTKQSGAEDESSSTGTTEVVKSTGAKYNFSTYLRSQYVGSFGGAVFHNQPVVQTSLSINIPNGISFGAWVSKSLKSGNDYPNFGNEIDGWVSLTKTVPGKFKVTGNVLYLNSSPVTQIPSGDFLNTSLTINRPIFEKDKFSFSASAFLVNCLPLDRKKSQGGWFFIPSGEFRYKLSRRVDLTASPAVSRDDGAFGFNPAWISRLPVNARVYLNRARNTFLEFGVTFSSPLTRTRDGRQTQWVPQLGLSHSW